jgi:hypothetical protein
MKNLGAPPVPTAAQSRTAEGAELDLKIKALKIEQEHLRKKRIVARAIQFLAAEFGGKYQNAAMALKALGLDPAWTDAILEIEKEMRL